MSQQLLLFPNTEYKPFTQIRQRRCSTNHQQRTGFSCNRVENVFYYSRYTGDNNGRVTISVTPTTGGYYVSVLLESSNGKRWNITPTTRFHNLLVETIYNDFLKQFKTKSSMMGIHLR